LEKEKPSEMKKVDVLIIGSEGAGARAAIQAHDRGAKVLIVTKGRMARSGATITAGMDIDMDSRSAKELLGLAGNPEDSPEVFFEDMVEAGKFVNNQKIVQRHVEDAPQRIKEVVDWGMKVVGFLHGPPKGRIVFLATPDEEFATRANIGYLFSQGKIAGDFVIVGEFSGTDNVFLGMKGGVWGDLKVRGRAAHASQALNGINAFEKLARVVVKVEEEFKPRLLETKSAYSFTPPEYKSPTAMIGGITRGSNVARSAVPDLATASFDLRTIPEDRDHRLVEDFRNFLDSLKIEIPDLDLEMSVASQFPCYALAEDSPLVQAFKEVVPRVIGKAPSFSISCAATEAAFFARNNIAAVAYGPGTWRNAHAKDEYVLIEGLECAAHVYAGVAARLLSGQGD
jgi:succinyl-diaminopimelate desuccinylase